MIIRNLINIYDQELSRTEKEQSTGELDSDIERSLDEELSQGNSSVDWIHAGSPKNVRFSDLAIAAAPEYKAAFVGLASKLRAQLTKDLGLERNTEIPNTLEVRIKFCSGRLDDTSWHNIDISQGDRVPVSQGEIHIPGGLSDCK